MLLSLWFRPLHAWSSHRGVFVSLKHAPTSRYLTARALSSTADSRDPASTLWKGASHSTSHFCTHVIASDDRSTVQQAVQIILSERRKQNATNSVPSIDEGSTVSSVGRFPLDNDQLTCLDLLRIGAVWFLPEDAPRDPSRGTKPVRLSSSDAQQILNEGDYLRIHHSPRRFPLVYDYNWTKAWQPPTTIPQTETPGLVVARNDEKGYWILDKPAHIPVHPTVDNVFENVAEQLRNARREMENESLSDSIYVSTPQRLDQNTSGLLVVATRKIFASYFAWLLRRKTDTQLIHHDNTGENGNTTEKYDAIHKRYKCLVCLSDSSLSVARQMETLQSFVAQATIMRHYLEPSIRAPKHFSPVKPENDTWAECLLRLTDVGDIYPLVGSQEGQELARVLWPRPDSAPSDCVAVVELEVELLTGRTHQIRGQLAAEGYPLVGDVQYGGAIPVETEGYHALSDKLALQCCLLEFLDPDLMENENGETFTMPSERWNQFRLEESWWSPHLHRYRDQTKKSLEVTTSAADAKLVCELLDQDTRTESTLEHDDSLLPPAVHLAEGVHKYVLVKATRPSDGRELWFVKSETPSRAGGPFHADVAKDLVEWLQAAGYDTFVTGGGRINYSTDEKRATVYGFSYGFGKGDHERAANLISDWSDGSIEGAYDTSDGLY